MLKTNFIYLIFNIFFYFYFLKKSYLMNKNNLSILTIGLNKLL